MKSFRRTQTRDRGFTLMELLVVVSIMVILAGLTMGVMGYVNQKQAVETAKLQLGLLDLAIEEYKADNGKYPAKRFAYSGRPSAQSISELQDELCPPEGATDSDTGKKKKIYLTELDPDNDTQGWLSGSREGSIEILDPWGTFYYYRTNNPKSSKSVSANPGYDLWSAGPDGLSTFRDGDYDPTAKNNLDDVRNW